MAEKRIYRQAALDRLASPEQLDHLVPVVDARGWLALAVCAVLALGVLAWSLAGALPVEVAARGTLAGDGLALLHVPAAAAGAIRPGMPVVLLPIPRDGGAVMRGTVARVAGAEPGGAYHGVHIALHADVHVAGMSVEGAIVLSRQRPIAFLIPALR